MSGSRIIILRGNSGSGKTTIARRLQRELGHGTLLLSQDMVRREMIYVRDEPENQAVDLLVHLMRYGLSACKTVILEGILYSDYYEELFKEISDGFQENIYAYYFDLPFEETLLRHQTKRCSNEFGEADMKRWWREQDHVPALHEKTIYKEMDEEAIVHMILEEIRR